MIDYDLCQWLRENSSGVYRPAAEAARRIEALSAQINRLLAHCPDGECDVCSEIICDHGDSMHFHHDGCPSCSQPQEQS